MVEYDLIVVGAGPFGMIAAHTWLELHSKDNVLVLEAGPDVGGVWSHSRLYPTMMTQTPLGMFEYSCFPMPPLEPSQTFYDLMPGSHAGAYLDAFSQHKAFAGKTVKERVMFNSKVQHIIKFASTWNVEIESGNCFTCSKLILATGLTSTPNIPSFPSKNFTPPIIHSKSLASEVTFLSSPEIKHVVVLGGSKSAFDAVILLRSLNKTVTWLIRKEGQGPALLATPDAPWPLSNSHQIISMRLVSKMSPCIFEPPDNWSRVFHSSTVGIWLVDRIWGAVDGMWKRAADYGKDANRAGLRPERTVFWSSDGAAVLNSPGLWDRVSEAEVLRDQVQRLEGRELVLRSGRRVGADAVVACTGWLNTFPFFDITLARQLGLPLPLTDKSDDKDTREWESKLASADAEIVKTFPRLANPPHFPDRKPKSTPNKLFRGIVPIKGDTDHSVAFLGTVGTTQSFSVAEIQALYAAAYLDGTLPIPKQEKMEEAVALAIAWRRRRYGGDGDTFILEQLQYCSMLLRDLGLNDQRKGGGWREILQPYQSADFRGIVDEWKGEKVENGLKNN